MYATLSSAHQLAAHKYLIIYTVFSAMLASDEPNGTNQSWEPLLEQRSSEHQALYRHAARSRNGWHFLAGVPCAELPAQHLKILQLPTCTCQGTQCWCQRAGVSLSDHLREIGRNGFLIQEMFGDGNGGQSGLVILVTRKGLIHNDVLVTSCASGKLGLW